MATIDEERHAKENWASDLDEKEIALLRRRRYLLQRPGNSPLNWTAVLAARPDMTQIDGLQVEEFKRTKGIVSLGIFPNKTGKSRNDSNAQQDPHFYMTEPERAEMEAQQAEEHAKALRGSVEDGKKLKELEAAKEEIQPRPKAPVYGSLSKNQLVVWARENMDLKIKLPMNKVEVINSIEKALKE